MTRNPKSNTTPPRRRTLGERGAIAVQTAVVLVVLLALVSLGVEVTLVLVKHRQMQTAADAASMAGVAALNINASYDTEARAVAAQHGFIDGQASASVAVHNPPLAGAHIGDANYVEVVISQPQAVTLAKLLRPGDFDVGARAVAVRNPGTGGTFCLLSLDSASPNAVNVSNNVVLANPSCGLAANSSSASSVHLHNNATVSGPIWTHGDIQRDNGSSTPNPSITTHGAVLADPYAAIALPAFTGTCSAAISVPNSGVQTIASAAGGVCYNGWTLGQGSTLNLGPGVYYLRNVFDLGNNATINGTGGVTVVVDNNFSITFGTRAHVNITAPIAGVWSGLGLMGWSTNSSGLTQNFNNTSTVNIVGAIYFPSQTVNFSNNVDTSASRCTQVIGRLLAFNNNVTFNYNCAGTGVRPIGPYGSKLAE